MRVRLFFIIALASVFAFSAQAQRRGRGYRQLASQLKAQSALNDSIVEAGEKAAQQMDSIARRHHLGSAPAAEGERTGATAALDNPYYFPLFTTGTLLRQPLRYVMGSLDAPLGTATGLFTQQSSSLINPEVTSKTINYLAALPSISWMLAETYAIHPEVITLDIASENAGSKQTGADTPLADAREEASRTAGAPVQINQERHEDVDMFDLGDFHIHIRRPNFWTFKGSFSTQFMQYYVSDNWYKGGDNHVSMLGALNLEANYDNKQKLTFSNKLETKLGFQTSPSDTYHKFKTNADLLRLTDKLGLQASKRWYYTVMLQSWTQFYKSYKSNSDNVASDFMSPFEAVLSVGMDYKLQKKRVNLTATLSPAAANLKYCDRTSIVKNHGIDEGKHVRYNLGSTITVNMTLKFCEQINWVTRLYAFYDYQEHLKAEWENTINLKVNKYLSTKLFLYPRFDNNVAKKNPEDTYFQFNEYLSVGLDLNF